MNLFSTKYANIERTISGTYLVDQEDVLLKCDTSGAIVGITLASIVAGYWNTVYKLYIVDNSGNATVNNITINAGTNSEGVQQKINGANSITINVSNGYAVLNISSDNTYIAKTSACCGDAGSYTEELLVADQGSWTVPAGVTTVYISMTGGGAGGGGASSADPNSIAAGGGGGAGDAIISTAVTVTPGQVISVSIGIGGAGGAPGFGGTGGTATTFSSTIPVSCNGGSGGGGGSATGGGQSISGGGSASGLGGAGADGTIYFGGGGGGGIFGSGGPSNGTAAGGYGSGGGGGFAKDTATQSGGRGSDGFILIKY